MFAKLSPNWKPGFAYLVLHITVTRGPLPPPFPFANHTKPYPGEMACIVACLLPNMANSLLSVETDN
jgi:hypothetical protein